MDLRQFVRHSGLYLLGNVASRAVGFLMIPVYGHYLSPAEYGVIELIELFIQVAVITFGIQALGGSMIRIYHDFKDDHERKAVVSGTLISAAAVGFLVSGAAIIFADPLSRLAFQSTEHQSLLRAAFVAAFFANCADVSLLYFRLRDRVSFVVGYSLVQLVVSFALNILTIVVFGLGIWGFVITKLVTSIAGAALLLTMVLRETGMKWNVKVNARQRAFALPLVLTGVATFIIHFSDRFFLARWSTLDEVGVYSLAYKFGFLISFLVGEPFGRVWNVKIYDYAHHSEWRERTGQAATYLVFFLFLAGLGISLFMGPLLGVMTSPAYAKSALLVPVVVLGYIARELGDFFKTLLYINKRAYLVGKITWASAILNIALNALLIPQFGGYGAAWSTVATWGVYLAAMWHFSQREHRIPYGVARFGQVCAISLIFYGLTRIGPGLPEIVQLGRNVVLLSAFCLALIWTGYLPRSDLRRLFALASNVRARIFLTS